MGRPPAYLDVSDAQVHFDTQSKRWIWEDDSGIEYEWHGQEPSKEAASDARITAGGWVRVIGDDEMAKQQDDIVWTAWTSMWVFLYVCTDCRRLRHLY